MEYTTEGLDGQKHHTFTTSFPGSHLHSLTTNYAISQNLGCHMTIPEQGLAHWAILYYWRKCSAKKVSAKTWRIFAPYDAISMTTGSSGSWNYRWPGSILSPLQFSHTPGFIKKIFAFRGFCSKISLFFYIFLTFDNLFKDLKVVHGFLARERQQINMKTPINLGKDDIWRKSLIKQVNISHTVLHVLAVLSRARTTSE